MSMSHTSNAQSDSERDTPTTLTLTDKEGHPIRTLEHWYALAPPKKPVLQWKDGRSAKECARAWLRTGVPVVPGEILEVLNAHPLTEGFVGVRAVPEATIQLDHLRGEHRNADMLLVGEAQGRKVVVTIDAKVDEEFGPVVGEYYDDHPRPTSTVQDRIDGLVSAMFGRGLDEDVRALRYQLLHGTAATLVAAGMDGAEVAVFLVHVFKTHLCDPVKAERNRADWDRFVGQLDTAQRSTGHTPDHEVQLDDAAGAGRLRGPYSLPGGGLVPDGIPLLLGYCEVVTGLHSPDHAPDH
jgi:hypothetical protein